MSILCNQGRDMDINDLYENMKKVYSGLNLCMLHPSRIGHMIANIELCLRVNALQRILFKKPKLYAMIYQGEYIANTKLFEMVHRILPIICNDKDIKFLEEKVNTDGDFVRYYNGPLSMFNEYYPFNIVNPILSFNDQEKAEGKKLLDDMGIGDNPFVCIHSRGKGYLSGLQPEIDWSYHDYRDCDVNDYMLASDWLTKRGIYVVRMGQIVDEQLNTDNPMIIDYALKHRTELGDLYLPAHCKFFLGCTSGMFVVAEMFGRPAAVANMVPLAWTYPVLSRSLMIPKLMKKDGEYMKLTQMLLGKQGEGGDFYKLNNIEIVNNSPEDILDLAMEMNARVDGTWQTTTEDEDIQMLFRNLHHNDMRTGDNFRCRLGTMFMRKHKGDIL